MNQNLAAGLLMCKISLKVLQYFLVHPGGPYYVRKDAGIWTIPKGLPEPGEALIDTARREFLEETGIRPNPPFHEIGTVKQKGGKVVYAWTFLGDWDPASGITCNTFTLEWPPKSGKTAAFPEVDKARWMVYEEAVTMINPAQVPFLGRAKEAFVIG